MKLRYMEKEKPSSGDIFGDLDQTVLEVYVQLHKPINLFYLSQF